MCFVLYILFNDNHIEKHLVNRFSNLSETKSKYYYYEKPIHDRGKGVCILRSDINCFEISPYPLPEWEKQIDDELPF